MTLSERWNHFWFESRRLPILSLLRIFFGLVFFCKLTGFYALSKFPNWAPSFPKRLFSSETQYFLSGFSAAYPGLDWLPVLDFAGWQFLESATLFFCVLFILGFAMRITGPVLALLYLYRLMVSQLLYSHHIWHICIVLILLGFSRSAEYYSLDAFLRPKTDDQKRGSVLPLRMIQIMTTFLYLATALSKFNHGWLSGEMLSILHDNGRMQGAFTETILNYIDFRTLGILTVLAEFFIPLALWIPYLRWIAIACGFGLHLSIDLMMHVTTYGYQMIVLYFAFMPSWRSTR